MIVPMTLGLGLTPQQPVEIAATSAVFSDRCNKGSLVNVPMQAFRGIREGERPGDYCVRMRENYPKKG